MLCGDLDGKEIHGRGDICMCVAASSTSWPSNITLLYSESSLYSALTLSTLFTSIHPQDCNLKSQVPKTVLEPLEQVRPAHAFIALATIYVYIVTC